MEDRHLNQQAQSSPQTCSSLFFPSSVRGTTLHQSLELVTPYLPISTHPHTHLIYHQVVLILYFEEFFFLMYLSSPTTVTAIQALLESSSFAYN